MYCNGAWAHVVVECVEQKVSLSLSSFSHNMEQKKDLNLLWKMVESTFGDVDEVCNEINEAAIELAVTPLQSWTDYPTVQRAIGIMLELRRAFEVLKPNVEVTFPEGWGKDEDK